MFGITTTRKKNTAVYDCTSTALKIANIVEFMLSTRKFRVREKLQAGERVDVGIQGLEIRPANGAHFNATELRQMELALNTSFSAQLYPGMFHIQQPAKGILLASIHPVSR